MRNTPAIQNSCSNSPNPGRPPHTGLPKCERARITHRQAPPRESPSPASPRPPCPPRAKRAASSSGTSRNLSQLNMSGRHATFLPARFSCTMSYNPKGRNEVCCCPHARLLADRASLPKPRVDHCKACLQTSLFEIAEYSKEIFRPGRLLASQPAAGAHGELNCLVGVRRRLFSGDPWRKKNAPKSSCPD